MKTDLIKYAEEQLLGKKQFPEFKAGDTVTVHYKIKEGDKERIQNFSGVVIQRRGAGHKQSFTVRKISNGVGVERVFPLFSPFIEEIEVTKVGNIRRAKLFYLRNLTGKKARIKEKFENLIGETGTDQTAEAEKQQPVAEETK